MLRRLVCLCVLAICQASLLSQSFLRPSHPCKYESENYSLQWKYDDLSEDVVFSLTAKSNMSNYWTGVYFGDVKPSDVVGVYVRSKQIGLIDAHFGGENDGKLEIVSDVVTNVQTLSFDVQDDGLSIEFGRPLINTETDDVDLNQCVTFFVPKQIEEIDASGTISIPSKFDSFPVCDITSSCSSHKDSDADIEKQDEITVCSVKEGDAVVEWEDTDEGMHFVIQTPIKHGKAYSAIGVGDEMENMKMTVLFTENGKMKHAGGYSSKGYRPPKKDPKTSVRLDKKMSSVKNGEAVYHLIVGSKMFADQDENGCITLQIAVNAGTYVGHFNIRKHEKTPIPVKVCGINKCRTGREEVEGSGTEASGEGSGFGTRTLRKDPTSRTPELLGEYDPQSLSQKRNAEDEGSGVVDEELRNLDEVAPVVEEVTEKREEEEKPTTSQAAVPIDDSLTDNGEEQRRQNEQHVPTVTETAKAENDTKVEETMNERIDEEVVVENSTKTETNQEAIHSITNVDEAEANAASVKVETTSRIRETSSTTTEATTAHVQKVVIEISTQPTNENDDKKISPWTSGQAQDGDTATSAAADPTNNVTSTVPTDVKPTTEPNQAIEQHSTTPIVEEIQVNSTTNQPPSQSTEVIDRTALITSKSNEQIKITIHECDSSHRDLRVCQGYFADYLDKVEEWATRHNEPVEKQMWKACSLLSTVSHVPTMCCTQFRATCSDYIRNT